MLRAEIAPYYAMQCMRHYIGSDLTLVFDTCTEHPKV